MQTTMYCVRSGRVSIAAIFGFVLFFGHGCAPVTKRIEVGELRERVIVDERPSPTAEIDTDYEDFLTSGDFDLAVKTIAQYERWLSKQLKEPMWTSFDAAAIEVFLVTHEWTWEQMYVVDKLSDLYYYYGLGLARDAKGKQKRDALEVFEKSRAYGLAGLCYNNDFRLGLVNGKRIREIVDTLQVDDLASINNLGASWARVGEYKGVLTQLQNLTDITALYERSLEIDPGFNAGVGHIVLGSVYCALPKALGGDLELGGEHFDRALQIDQTFLETYVLYAEYYLRTIGDAEGYKRALHTVVDAPDDLSWIFRRENALAKERAATLLEGADSIF